MIYQGKESEFVTGKASLTLAPINPTIHLNNKKKKMLETYDFFLMIIIIY